MVILLVLIFIDIAMFIGNLIANYYVLKKIGENKWLGFVPIINSFIIFRSFWNVKAFIAYLMLTLTLNVDVIYRITCSLFGITISSSTSILPISLSIIISLILIFMIIRLYDKISSAFGLGGLWTLGLVILYPLFAILIAVRYEPNKEIVEKIKSIKQKK